MEALADFSRRHGTALIAAALFAANVLIRLPNLHYPNHPVFDESYYATYAANYATRSPSIDIHPPLGKMIYSLPLLLSPAASYNDKTYIDYRKSFGFKNAATTTVTQGYQTFPYYPLRVVSALWGALLAAGIFLFTRALTGRLAPAALAGTLITLENAIILETKLILVNGMLLAFGFWGLYFLLKRRSALAGSLVGLAVSVKLTAGIFGIIAFLAMAMKGVGYRKFLSFVLSACAAFLAVTVLIENLVVPIAEKEAFFEDKLFSLFRNDPEWQPPASNEFGKKLASLVPDGAVPYVKVIGAESLISLAGYTTGQNNSEQFMKSRWFEWPFMVGSFPYLFESGDRANPTLVLLGNPIVWGLGGAGALLGVKRSFESARRRRRGENAEERGAVELLSFSYLAYLALFLLFVRRDAFLYHYFPSLILGVILFSMLFSEFADGKTRRVKFWLYFSVISISFLGFVLIAPFTYGTAFF